MAKGARGPDIAIVGISNVIGIFAAINCTRVYVFSTSRDDNSTVNEEFKNVYVLAAES